MNHKAVCRSALATLCLIIIIPLYFTHVWLREDLVFALLLAIWWICFVLGPAGEKPKKLYCQVGFIESKKKKIIEKLDFLPLCWQSWLKMLLNTKFWCRFQIWNNFFLKFKIKCEKIIFKLELAKWRQKTWFVCFFKCWCGHIWTW